MPKNHGDMTFDKALKGFITSTKNSMKYALACSLLAIQHFEKCGDVIYCQNFLDAMPKNYVRRAAFLKWLAAHSPITMEDSKLLKDKSDKAVKFDLEGAEKAPFWEFAPDMEVVVFDQTDVIKALQAVLKRYRNTERNQPKDSNVISLLDVAEAKVLELSKATIYATTAPSSENELTPAPLANVG